MSVARWCLIAATAACSGGGGNAAKDARSSDAHGDGAFDASFDAPWDAAIDAALVCTSCGPITVTVYGDGTVGQVGQTVAGVDVWFIWPDQTATKVVSDANGVAVGTGPDGTEVLVVRHEAQTQWKLSAYEGLLAGDAITDHYSPPPDPTTPAASVYVSHATVANALNYAVRGSCGAGTTSSATTQVISPVACGQFGSASIAAVAYDSSNTPLAYSVATGIDYAAHDGSGNGITLPAFQPLPSVTVNVTNVTESTSFQFDVRYTLGSDSTMLGLATAYTGGINATEMATAPIVPVGDHTSLHGYINLTTSLSYLEVVQQLATRASTLNIDMTNSVHPAKNGHYDTATSSMVWTEAAGGVDATTVTGYAVWTSFASNQVHLTFMAPHGATTSLPLPTIPAALSQLAVIPDQVSGAGVQLSRYVGKSYHDGLIGQTAGADQWLADP